MISSQKVAAQLVFNIKLLLIGYMQCNTGVLYKITIYLSKIYI